LDVRRRDYDHVNGRGAAVGGQLLDLVARQQCRWQLLSQRADHVPQLMNLLLAGDLTVGTAGVLDVRVVRTGWTSKPCYGRSRGALRFRQRCK
jgi:hypothetical protein